MHLDNNSCGKGRRQVIKASGEDRILGVIIVKFPVGIGGTASYRCPEAFAGSLIARAIASSECGVRTESMHVLILPNENWQEFREVAVKIVPR